MLYYQRLYIIFTYSIQKRKQISLPLLSPTNLYVSYFLYIRKTVPLIRSAISTVVKRTTTIVLTTSSKTVPGTTKRGLPTIRSITRTVTAITTTVVIYATITISVTTRIGSTATRTMYTSQKVLLAPIQISQIQHLPIAPLLYSLLITIAVLKSPISSLTPTLYITSTTILLRLVVTRSATSRFIKAVVYSSISAVPSIIPSILRVIYIASILPFSLYIASFSST